MITEAIANWFLGLCATVIGWLPDAPTAVDTAVGDFSGQIGEVLTFIAKFDPIIPFDQIGVAAAIIGVFAGLALAVQIGRIGISIFTLGGGGV